MLHFIYLFNKAEYPFDRMLWVTDLVRTLQRTEKFLASARNEGHPAKSLVIILTSIFRQAQWIMLKQNALIFGVHSA